MFVAAPLSASYFPLSEYADTVIFVSCLTSKYAA
nr:MAG TPA_asm: hypothetical protein [Caudoviricetes sp.]